MRYLRVELAESGNVCVFVFEGSQAQGDDLKAKFDAGLFERVEPRTLLAARGYLSKAMMKLRGADHAK